ncbi:MAG: PAS domain S-box protein [Okeania sp. SIO3C4]|nr:PAS domain S-box protein [Okeania sp. SIO3B3]NER07716.1 PAS domain S-box protein [Okeania sp. SIO3C4]
MLANEKNLWQILWEYAPNGLIVVDTQMNITLVNPAFCKMFNVNQTEIIGQPASIVLEDLADFQKVWEKDEVIRGKEKKYQPKNQANSEADIVYVKEVIFPIRDQNLIAGIMVDITHEWQRKKEMINLRNETVSKVNEVVDHQMKVVQEIAGLLGETTAETKVSLLKIIKMVNQETL